MLGIGVASFALIVILSAFNGLEDIISGMNAKLAPDLLIEPRQGKTIDLSTFPTDAIGDIAGVEMALPGLKEDALFRADDKQHLGKIRGIDTRIAAIERISNTIYEGSFDTDEAAVVGAGVAWHLNISANDPLATIRIYVPQHNSSKSLNIENGFKSELLTVSGTFYTGQDSDETTVFTDYNTLARLMNMEGKANSIEVYAKPGGDMRKIRKNIASTIGNDFVIKDIYQQQATLYHIMRSEKWAVYLVLAFILVLSTFNVAGSLSMLIIDKRKDIGILTSMGADKKLTRKVFLTEGILIAVAGGIIGLALGIVTVWLQQRFGFVKFGTGGGSYIIDTYPVALRIGDIITILATLIAVGLGSSALTVRIAMKKIGH